MKLGLGIDTCGAYTDTVLMDLSDGRILDSNKVLTMHSNLVEGIKSNFRPEAGIPEGHKNCLRV